MRTLVALMVAVFAKDPVNEVVYAPGITTPFGCGYAFRYGATVGDAFALAKADGTLTTEG